MSGRLNNYLSLVLNIAESKFFKVKLSLNEIECIQLETSARLNLPYWDSKIDDQAADYLLNVKSDDKVLSEKILKKMVNQRRRKQLLREEIETLAKSFRELLSHA